MSAFTTGSTETHQRTAELERGLVDTLASLFMRLGREKIRRTDVLPWGSPVLAFGDLATARVATVGVNPSDREFVDRSGQELKGRRRRFHTLHSLGIESWAEADARHMRMILDTYRSYFFRNPYDSWFRRLDFVIAGTGASYYDPAGLACHLDLVPYATERKWSELGAHQRTLLLELSRDVLGNLLRNSPVDVLVLNGNSVVRQFERMSGTDFESREMPSWSLTHGRLGSTRGLGFRGRVDVIGNTALDRSILVLGFNHNLQSSWGVSREVARSIRGWITRFARPVLGP